MNTWNLLLHFRLYFPSFHRSSRPIFSSSSSLWAVALLDKWAAKIASICGLTTQFNNSFSGWCPEKWMELACFSNRDRRNKSKSFMSFTKCISRTIHSNDALYLLVNEWRTRKNTIQEQKRSENIGELSDVNQNSLHLFFHATIWYSNTHVNGSRWPEWLWRLCNIYGYMPTDNISLIACRSLIYANDIFLSVEPILYSIDRLSFGFYFRIQNNLIFLFLFRL